MEAKFWVSSEFRLLLGTYRYVKLTFQSNLFENTDSTGRFTMYAWNVVLNVNMFTVVISVATPFSFELISENVSIILGIKRIQTITWYLQICQIYFLKQFV